jgi:hypothetical protein
MKFTCPKCRRPLLPENINAQTDLAVCKECGEVSRLSELADSGFDPAALQSPPPGAWYREVLSEHIFGATTRSPVAFFLVPFMCVWSGFSLFGIYGTQIRTGHFNLTASLFGIPFILGSLLFWTFALMACFGKVELRIRDGRGKVFTGIGAVGWTRSFNLDEVDRIEEQGTNTRYPGAQGTSIVLIGKTLLRCASNVSEPRRYFLVNVLKRLKAQRAGRSLRRFATS